MFHIRSTASFAFAVVPPSNSFHRHFGWTCAMFFPPVPFFGAALPV